MAENESPHKDIYNANDPLDINELAALNDDISTEFIEQLQSQLSGQASEFTGKPATSFEDDSTLFEEVSEDGANLTPGAIARMNLDDNIDDNFIKKYKAKIKKQIIQTEQAQTEKTEPEPTPPPKEEAIPEVKVTVEIEPVQEEVTPESPKEPVIEEVKPEVKEQKTPQVIPVTSSDEPEIENLTSGNIVEKPIQQGEIDYNESLDYLDGNVNYSKYVIYIDPENKEFVDSLTVKERKNLINKIIREQDDIAITKKRLGVIQTVIKHSIVAIITIAISIPIIYIAINASLEASINNYRRSQTIFKTLYKEKGKIRTNPNVR